MSSRIPKCCSKISRRWFIADCYWFWWNIGRLFSGFRYAILPVSFWAWPRICEKFVVEWNCWMVCRVRFQKGGSLSIRQIWMIWQHFFRTVKVWNVYWNDKFKIEGNAWIVWPQEFFFSKHLIQFDVKKLKTLKIINNVTREQFIHCVIIQNYWKTIDKMKNCRRILKDS